MEDSPLFLGIDFGTSNSSVAHVYHDPRYADQKVIPVQTVPIPLDEAGNVATNRMPTLLSTRFDDRRAKGFLVGWEFFQRFGRRKKSPLLRRGRDLFESVKSDLGSFRIYPYAAAPECNMPEKVAEAVFARLLREVTPRLPGASPGAVRTVITVPASLNAEARRQTLEAAVRAGLVADRVELIDEPIAALLDLLNDPRSCAVLAPGKPTHVLVFDYGGGTLDLCLVRCAYDSSCSSGLTAETLAISRYRRNGGNDVDRQVMARVVWPQVEEQLGILRTGLRADVRQAVEDTLTPTVARGLKEGICKRIARDVSAGRPLSRLSADLSEIVKSDGTFTDEGLPAPIEGKFKITKAQFDQVMSPFLTAPSPDPATWGDERVRHSLVLPILETLDKAGLGPGDLDVLVLHGGSCRNPHVQAGLLGILAEADGRFAQTRIVETPDLDTSVARGAALACYWKHARKVELIRPVVAEDVGILTLGEQPVCLVESGTPLPFPELGIHAHPEDFFVPQAGQREMLVPFYTGRHEQRRSGCVRLPLPDGVRKGEIVRIKLSIDRDKVLHWWFSLSGGEFRSAPSLDDPWTLREPDVAGQAVQRHRKEMRDHLSRHGSVPRGMAVREALLLYHAGDLAEAELAIFDCVAGGSHDADTANALSLIYGHTEDAAAEMYFAEMAARLAPRDPIMLGNYGVVLDDNGRGDEAVAMLRAALSLAPDLSYLHERLGDRLRAGRDEEAAVREYREALRIVERRLLERPERPQNWKEAARLHYKLGEYDQARDAAGRASDAGLNELYGGDHRMRIAGPDSGF